MNEPLEGHALESLVEEERGWVLRCECSRQIQRASSEKCRIAYGHHLGIVRSRRSLEGA